MRRSTLAFLGMALFATGCWESGPQDIVGCDGSSRAGIVSIRWTINGAPPSETSCTGVARLQLRVTDECSSGVISPIPCTLDKVRFDGQPYGDTYLTLEAIGTSEQLLYTGNTEVFSLESPPATPDLITLAPPQPF